VTKKKVVKITVSGMFRAIHGRLRKLETRFGTERNYVKACNKQHTNDVQQINELYDMYATLSNHLAAIKLANRSPTTPTADPVVFVMPVGKHSTHRVAETELRAIAGRVIASAPDSGDMPLIDACISFVCTHAQRI
jgi:hypothetical protein